MIAPHQPVGHFDGTLIPAFAVERSQELIHDLSLLARRREIPTAPVFLDSPLAQRADESGNVVVRRDLFRGLEEQRDLFEVRERGDRHRVTQHFID